MTQLSKPRFQSSRASLVQASLLSSNGCTISRASCAISNPGQQLEISGLAQADTPVQLQLLNAPVAVDAGTFAPHQDAPTGSGDGARSPKLQD
jgi:hypothetical protein